jgi:transcriptional regulator with XRE-family HTH domain
MTADHKNPAAKMKAPSPIDVHVGSRMRMRRLMLGMSQQKLAEAFGLTFQQVQKYEKGMNRMGSSRLQQAADILGVAVPFFFEGVPEKQAPGHAALLPNYLNEFTSSQDGIRLIKAFTRLDNADLRRAVVRLVEETALRDGE